MGQYYQINSKSGAEGSDGNSNYFLEIDIAIILPMGNTSRYEAVQELSRCFHK